MRRLSLFTLFTPIICLFIFSSCGDDFEVTREFYEEDEYALIAQKLNLDNAPTDYTVEFPSYYPRDTRTFNNSLATLGRVLFYDANLSVDRSISCGSCHQQEKAFADGKAHSDGVNGRKTARNSLALGSVFSFNEYYGNPTFGGVPFFWDNRAFTVQEQSKQTFANVDEMGMEMSQVIDRVKEEDFYKPLFRNAFGNDKINEQRILDAIGEFVNSMASVHSKYDTGLEAHFNTGGNNFDIGDIDFPSFTAEENLGKKLYINNCASCHGNINGSPGLIAANNGLEMDYNDGGVGQTTGEAHEKAIFKVPTLRNITLTQPYMHDGRFATLEEVIDHYSTNIQPHVNLSAELTDNFGAPKQFNFTAEEKAALITFLATFEDDNLLTLERFSNPFKQ